MWRFVVSSLLWACSTRAAPPAPTTAGAGPDAKAHAEAPPPEATAPPLATTRGDGADVTPVDPPPDPTADSATPKTRGEVILVPLGKFPVDQIDAVAEHLREHAQVDVRAHPERPLPKDAWYAKRKRYRADKIIEMLEAEFVDAPATTHVLALTMVDISTSKPPHEDWGIFGLGQMPGRAAVVSTFRLRKKATDSAHLKRRLGNTTLHELGHTFGLDHCTEVKCPMQDAEGSIVNTDAANDDFSEGCRAKIDRLVPLRSATPP